MAKINAKNRVRLALLGVLVVSVIMGVIVFPKYVDRGIDAVNGKFSWHIPHVKTVPFMLGLDLQGGSHLVYEANTSTVPADEQGAAVEGVRDVIERRVNAFGVSEPIVQTNKSGDHYRVIVELAGVKDIKQAIDMIGQTPLLEFKEQNTEPPRELTPDEKKQLEDFNKAAKTKADETLKKVMTEGADYVALVKELSDDVNSKETGGALGIISVEDYGQKPVYDAIVAAKGTAGMILPTYVQSDEGYNIIKVNAVTDGPEEVKASHLLICFKGAQSCDKETSKEDALKKIQELKAKATTENFAQLVKENSTEPGADTKAGDLGYFTKQMMVPAFADAAFAMDKGKISDPVESPFGYHLIYKVDARKTQQYDFSRLLIATKSQADIVPPSDAWKNTELGGKQLKRATVQFDQFGTSPQVSLEFNDEGSKLFAEITARNVGKPVAIYLDNEPISIPTVNEPITGGQAVISGNFDVAEAKLLAQRLNAGALPVAIELISQETVGASLGSESLTKSVFAGSIAFLLVLLFMIGYYRLPGLFSVIALGVYAAVVLFLFKMIPVTLTLSGIAGFVISAGMAVDANVLIFERLKEELRMGKPLGTAIEDAFKRAWPSIRDGNYSTLITCFMLFWFGTSTIKGFALTLSVGIIVSIFSAMVVTRLLLKVAVTKNAATSGWLWLGSGKQTEQQVKS